jgi:hypothetical protein
MPAAVVEVDQFHFAHQLRIDKARDRSVSMTLRHLATLI